MSLDTESAAPKMPEDSQRPHAETVVAPTEVPKITVIDDTPDEDAPEAAIKAAVKDAKDRGFLKIKIVAVGKHHVVYEDEKTAPHKTEYAW